MAWQPPAPQPEPAPPPPAPPTYAAPPPAPGYLPPSMPAAAPVAGQLSPDGSTMWNGTQWISAVSPDGRFRWNGGAWVPNSAPAYAVAVPATVAGAGLAYQFGGSAAWSIGFGLVSIIVPFATNFYFPILPLIGIWRAVLAIRAGRMAGGVIGIVLNLVGAGVSLLASGLLG